MSAELNPADWAERANNRETPRKPVHITAELRLAIGQKFKVSVLDLSQTGFRVETGNHMELGTRVYLAIPELNSLPANITWSDGTAYGCAFLNPLHKSVFEHIAREYPALVR